MKDMGQPGHGTLAVHDVKYTVVGEFTQHRRFHVETSGHGEKFLQLLRRHRQTHAFLGLGNQYFPRIQTGIFQRRQGEVHTATAALTGHFPHGGGEAARARCR